MAEPASVDPAVPAQAYLPRVVRPEGKAEGKDLQEEGCRKRIAARRPQEKCSRKRTNSGLQEDVLQNCRNEVAQSRLQEEAYT